MPEAEKILICGDPHGYFEYAARSAEIHGAEAVILLRAQTVIKLPGYLSMA